MAFEYLAQYTTFDSVAEMDHHVEQHIQQHYFDLTESERTIVFNLASRSLMYPGASHLKATTIADSLEISTKTVYRAISKLESLGIIKKETTTKEKGGRGASIYIILPYLAEYCGSPDKSFEQEAVQSEVVPLQVAYSRAHAEMEGRKVYMNEYQQLLFDFMHSLPLPDNFKDELHKVVLVSNVNGIQEFISAKNVMFKMARDIKEGVLTITTTLRAVFVGAYSKAVQRTNKQTITNTSSIEETAHKERAVPFYNWLTERNGPTEVF